MRLFFYDQRSFACLLYVQKSFIGVMDSSHSHSHAILDTCMSKTNKRQLSSAMVSQLHAKHQRFLLQWTMTHHARIIIQKITNLGEVIPPPPLTTSIGRRSLNSVNNQTGCEIKLKYHMTQTHIAMRKAHCALEWCMYAYTCLMRHTNSK